MSETREKVEQDKKRKTEIKKKVKNIQLRIQEIKLYMSGFFYFFFICRNFFDHQKKKMNRKT